MHAALRTASRICDQSKVVNIAGQLVTESKACTVPTWQGNVKAQERPAMPFFNRRRVRSDAMNPHDRLSTSFLAAPHAVSRLRAERLARSSKPFLARGGPKGALLWLKSGVTQRHARLGLAWLGALS